MSRLKFNLEAEATDSNARAASFTTLHGEVQTPVFMPVGTQATVKAQRADILEQMGSQVLLANTYHLLLRPGKEVFQKLGGIHSFMSWKKSVLTDSGGFQIFSLPHTRTMTEEGAVFQSYVDLDRVLLSPEVSIEMQKAIGSDIMMVLDQCVSSTSERTEAKEAMDRTHRWAKRSLEVRGDSEQALFGIVQGACFEELRKESALTLTELPFDGFAIGGLAVGESRAERENFTELTAKMLPKNLPRYLMGVGTPIDLLEAVHRGVDMFDCILPNALAQQGVAFVSHGRLELRRGAYRFSDRKLDPDCDCFTCANYSLSYLHHLIKVKEILGWQLIGQHNLHFYHRLMRDIRQSILNDSFSRFYREKRVLLQQSDENYPKRFPVHTKKKKQDRRNLLGDYELVRSTGRESGQEGGQGGDQTIKIRHVPSGEIMHSVNDPCEEAKRLYLEQSKLLERIKSGGSKELIIWDVGLGAATNAMQVVMGVEGEALSCAESPGKMLSPVRLSPVKMISFENDLNSFKLALANAWGFVHLRHAAPGALAKKGEWQSKVAALKWELRVGDFLETLSSAPVPDLIFFDPFSYKTNSLLWTVDCFQKIMDHCRGHSVELFTYSASTAVRAALLYAGFCVAKGVGTGPKAETTIALTEVAHQNGRVHKLLAKEWLEKWERSNSKVPPSLPSGELAEFEKNIRGHFQFH